MIDPGKVVKETPPARPAPPGPGKLFGAAIFGLAFGFLLQKGGVAKYNVLLGALLLEDWTVAKIMLTAILAGMIGVFTLHHFAKVNLHLIPTRLGAQTIGGILLVPGLLSLPTAPARGPQPSGRETGMYSSEWAVW